MSRLHMSDFLQAPATPADSSSRSNDNSRTHKRPRNWPPPGHPYSAPVLLPPPQRARHSDDQARQETAMHSGRTPETRRLSCKECRRLKLKCDRVFPCQSCVKRGCGDICPEGERPTSRFILANTGKLHDRIATLTERVRQLEEGLGALQTSVSPSQTHPLLSPELLQIKLGQDLPRPRSGSQSSVTVSQNQDSLKDSVSSLSINEPIKQPPYRFERAPIADPAGPPYSPPPAVDSDILQLSATFPFPWAVDLSIRKRIRDALPPPQEALEICHSARTNALWQYNLDSSETFLENLLHHCYESEVEELSPRRLALLLMVLSIGSLVDLNRPHGTLHGEAYHHLARASVCEIPLMEEPDFDVVHTLFFMLWFHLTFSDNSKAVGYAWNLMGFVAKLAQGIGLHRDGSARAKMMIPEEYEKRKLVFWELLNLDCRMSLSLGRPPSLSLEHVDVKPPTYEYVPKEEATYHQWKNGFFIKCLSPILEHMVNVKPSGYDHALELDGRVRDFGVPMLLDSNSKPNSAGQRFLVMQRALVTTSKDIALLQLHRRYFVEAMNGAESFDLYHQFAPSVLATYLSASSLITAVEVLYGKEPKLSVRFLCFWFNAFSASVTLSLFVCRAPSNPLAPFALQDLGRVVALFNRAAEHLPFSAKALPIMEGFIGRSHAAYMQWKNISVHSSRPSETTAVLPESFNNAHHHLCSSIEQIQITPPVPTLATIGHSTGQSSTPWLPNIYGFSSNGVGITDRYKVASEPATPFVPSVPRVNAHKTFDFAHGELTAEIEETSYMAWF